MVRAGGSSDTDKLGELLGIRSGGQVGFVCHANNWVSLALVTGEMVVLLPEKRNFVREATFREKIEFCMDMLNMKHLWDIHIKTIEYMDLGLRRET